MTSNPGELDLKLAEIVASGISLEVWRQKLCDALSTWAELGDGWRIYRCVGREISTGVGWSATTLGLPWSQSGKWLTGDDGKKHLVVGDESTWFCVARSAPNPRRWTSEDVTPQRDGGAS